MKKALPIVFLCSVALLVASGQSSGMSTAEQITKLEKDWAKATITDAVGSVDQYEADDIVTTDVNGRVTDKAQDKKDLSSGDVKYEAIEVREIKVHDHGDFAVATGLTAAKGSNKGKPFNATYRFTDTWAKHNGKWQCVAQHATKIEP